MMRVHQVPQQECMFALLDAPHGRGKQAIQELVYQFEAMLPCDIATLQMVFSRPLEDGKVVACACPKSQIESWQDRYDLACPASFPQWLRVTNADSVRSQLNLLSGAMRPRSVRMREGQTAKLLCFLSLVSLLLVFLGMQRRIESHRQARAVIEDQIAELYSGVLPPAAPGITQPDSIRFAAMLNQASAVRTGTSQDRAKDLIADLTTLLETWPEQSEPRTQSISLTSTGARLQLTLPSNEKAADFLSAFRTSPEWEIHTQETRPQNGEVSLTLELVEKTTRSMSEAAS